MHKPLWLSLQKINPNAPFSPRKARLDCRNKTVIFHTEESSKMCTRTSEALRIWKH